MERKGEGKGGEGEEKGNGGREDYVPHYKTSCGHQCTYVTPVGNKKKMEGKKTSKEREAEKSDRLDFVSLTQNLKHIRSIYGC